MFKKGQPSALNEHIGLYNRPSAIISQVDTIWVLLFLFLSYSGVLFHFKRHKYFVKKISCYTYFFNVV